MVTSAQRILDGTAEGVEGGLGACRTHRLLKIGTEYGRTGEAPQAQHHVRTAPQPDPTRHMVSLVSTLRPEQGARGPRDRTSTRQTWAGAGLRSCCGSDGRKKELQGRTAEERWEGGWVATDRGKKAAGCGRRLLRVRRVDGWRTVATGDDDGDEGKATSSINPAADLIPAIIASGPAFFRRPWHDAMQAFSNFRITVVLLDCDIGIDPDADYCTSNLGVTGHLSATADPSLVPLPPLLLPPCFLPASRGTPASKLLKCGVRQFWHGRGTKSEEPVRVDGHLGAKKDK
ncbi:hypothetical protein DFH09DRAFT_1096270 [Mycena vulgaris]|nr:hypothetical protein DFH09DRAFT_1096270 [Mycena vulgaris]